jgi:hypothetical protein
MAARSELENLLRQGMAAVKAGREHEARELLAQVVELDPENELGWLWLSAVVPDSDKATCLENVLSINPSSRPARLGLQSLLGESAQFEQEEEEELEAAESVGASAETWAEPEPGGWTRGGTGRSERRSRTRGAAFRGGGGSHQGWELPEVCGPGLPGRADDLGVWRGCGAWRGVAHGSP